MTDGRRDRLNRGRVLQAAVALADREGADAVSMRSLADHLGVVPMALYKHVAGKEDLLDGMVDQVVAEIDPPTPGVPWRPAVRARVLSAREAMLRHPWARRVLETRRTQTPAVLDHLDSTIGILRGGGFSDSLTHHVMHAFGSRVWGFTQELFADAPTAPPPPEAMAALAARYPHIAATMLAASHDAGTVVGAGCDDQQEFEFALDLALDGFERLRAQGWTPPPR
ncbi:TetR/AcrR family transcriptional regulator [Cellulomonas sp. S1-8]|uniref:TetR/AcrR family transcriptional regulator n=1 Tax=Cellulomonas sp. S1-8 TaxID=2904790 RepID=UPI0022440438|nr:TetR/AcrR family transcriptional regulator C-terminal domain-containing protein [Cellulomonas sp. S1-8]UZN04054.1 TetR/AcrR family transcriptional regulator C-terminal domain-containing protein [Cellulomonas sp. S1-8]